MSSRKNSTFDKYLVGSWRNFSAIYPILQDFKGAILQRVQK
jgi:hypothetical protein